MSSQPSASVEDKSDSQQERIHRSHRAPPDRWAPSFQRPQPKAKARSLGKSKTRASYRIYQKLKKTGRGASENKGKKRPCLRIARAVELVNQANGSWRDEKSKMLYMVALGLTPIFSKPNPGLIQPFPLIHPIPKGVLESAQARYRKIEEERQLRLKAARRRDRERKAEVIRRKYQHKNPAAQKEVVFIDLLSDDEDEQREPKVSGPSIHPEQYPNLTVNIVSRPNAPHTTNQLGTKACPTSPIRDFLQPTVVKKISWTSPHKGTTSRNRNQRMSPKRRLSVNNHGRRPLGPNANVVVQPSPPMVVTPEEIVSITASANIHGSEPIKQVDRSFDWAAQFCCPVMGSKPSRPKKSDPEVILIE